LKVRLKKELSSQYVGTFLRTNYVRERLSLESVGSTMENLNTSILGNIRVPSPPTNEQHEIDRFIVNQTAKLDALTAEAQSAIALLQERRTALISAAVTGQNDVRDFV
jgi:type I restriction enzyme S subunit